MCTETPRLILSQGVVNPLEVRRCVSFQSALLCVMKREMEHSLEESAKSVGRHTSTLA